MSQGAPIPLSWDQESILDYVWAFEAAAQEAGMKNEENL